LGISSDGHAEKHDLTKFPATIKFKYLPRPLWVSVDQITVTFLFRPLSQPKALLEFIFQLVEFLLPAIYPDKKYCHDQCQSSGYDCLQNHPNSRQWYHYLLGIRRSSSIQREV